MKIGLKIAILLAACAILLSCMAIFYKNAEVGRFSGFVNQEHHEMSESIRRLLYVETRPLEMLVRDYSKRDDVADFTYTGDRSWAKANIDRALDIYTAGGIWVYNADGTLLYNASDISLEAYSKLPLSSADVQKLAGLDSGTSHFFVPTTTGIMEVRGAAIHRSQSSGNRAPVSGYIFASRVWDSSFIDNLSKITNSDVNIYSVFEKKMPQPDSYINRGPAAFEELLVDWKSRAVARVSIYASSDIAGIFMKGSQRALIIFLGYTLALIALLYAGLIFLINAPLDKIYRALLERKAANIQALSYRRDEFGRIANFIDEFFRQRQSLLATISDHKEADEKLAKKMKELEDAYAQLQDMHAKLVQSEKLAALGRFASGLAHEVKNPLAILLGGLEYVKTRLPDADPEVREALMKMREAVLRADLVVKDLLAFARPSRVTAEVVHPNMLINDSIVFIELFRHKSDTADINIKQDLIDEDVLVEVDKNQMQQALFNILLNAIEALPMKGDISVKTYKDTARMPSDTEEKAVCVIEITDNGIGISREDMPKIFEPFFTTKRERKGTGLGLSIVKSIVDKNKGLVSISSEENKGTTVKIILPEARLLKKGATV